MPFQSRNHNLLPQVVELKIPATTRSAANVSPLRSFTSPPLMLLAVSSRWKTTPFFS
ncbi:hypothetical protein [Sinorhizobium meliloti]|uniref:hypothetical protein n=1 Tax=Rhizobium meliloti TaxID=382 RepID=UPI003EBBF216